MNQELMSPKSRRADKIMSDAGIWQTIDIIVSSCFQDAYKIGWDELDERFCDGITEERSGTIDLFESDYSIVPKNSPIILHEERETLFGFHENGYHSRICYRFDTSNRLTLSFALKDKYINRDNEYYSLITFVVFDDYRELWPSFIEAYTQPFIDCEDDIRQTLVWHELQR